MLATAIAIRPIGPQPVTTTVWPGDLLDEGRVDRVAQRLLERGDLGRVALVDPGIGLRAATTYWAKPPGTWTPRMRRFWQTWARPVRHW